MSPAPEEAALANSPYAGVPAMQDRLLARLRESEARFQALFEASSLGMALFNPDGSLISVNQSICEISGYSEAEILRSKSRDHIFPDDRDIDRELMAELVAGSRDSYRVEKRYLRKSGEMFWGRLTVGAVRAQDHRLLYLVGMLEDIDDQKRTLAELGESEELFRMIFENAAVGIGLVGLDRIVFAANDAMLAMSGYSRHEFLGLSGSDLIHPEDRAIGLEDYQEMMAGRRDSMMAERRYLRKNGKPFWTRQNISLVRDAQGNPNYLVVMVEDIDRQRNMLRELQESEARFRAMFSNTEIGIAMLSLDQRVLDVNPAVERIFGYDYSEMSAMSLASLILPQDQKVSLDLYAQMIAGLRSSFTIEPRFRRKDGQVIWTRLTCSVVPDGAGEALYYICLIEDITAQRQAQEQLKAQKEEHLRTLEQRVDERTRALAEINLRLMEEIEQRRRVEQALALKAAEEAVSAERTRLARDLHDAVTQTLFSASLIADVLPELWEIDPDEARRSTDELRQLSRGALAEMRTLLLELRPDAVTQARMADLLKQLSQALIGRAQLPVYLDVQGERLLPPEVQVAFYRIAQEALNNIVKYARASRVDIHLALSQNGAHMLISDDGVGFDQQDIRPSSLGMRIMRERAQGIGADFTVTSLIGEGSSVSVTWNDPRAEYDDQH